MRRIKPPHIIILSFLCAILLGVALLSLPSATPDGDQAALVDRFFTATSAACVTGLIVKEPASWAPFGRAVIMVLFQAGGLGIMTFSTLFAVILGRKISIKDNLVVKGTIGHSGIKNIKALLIYIVSIVFLFEGAGAALLFWRWRQIESWTLGTTAYNAIFHSVSAFCNAGFSLFNNSFVGFKGDAFINIIMIALIFIGGIGFIVILDIWNLRLRSKDKRPFFSRVSVQTKMALSISMCLIIIGSFLFFVLEKDNVLATGNAKEKILAPVFQAVTARTAGFNTLPIGKLATPTLIVLIFLMFIGASPGSTGGGIKTCTFGVLLVSIWAMIKNKERVWIFKRTIPREVVRKALVIFVLGLGWVFCAAFLLSITEKGNLAGGNYYLKILFETVSAFGTVGLTTGITPALSTLGKILIMITMFVGRIGPLTLALAVALQEDKALYVYPEEKLMVG